MERLLQGDVGSGKTVVALYALLRAVEAGFRGALMAPTETLAEQHFLTLESFCTQLGVTCGLLTSSAGKRDREQAARRSGRRRHPCAHPGWRRSRPAGRGGRRRAASLRRRAAQGALGGNAAAHAPHDGHADPADARADGVRRPVRVRDRRAARGSSADRHELGDGRAQLRGVPSPPSPPRGRTDRHTSSARSCRSRSRSRRGRPSRRPSGCSAPSCAGCGSAACTASCGRPSGAISWRASRPGSSTCSSPRR